VAPTDIISGAPTIRAPTNSPTLAPLSTIEDILCDATTTEFSILCAALNQTGLFAVFVNVTLFAPTDKAFVKYFDNGKSAASMVAMIGSTSSTVLNSTTLAAAAKAVDFNNENGFSFNEILLLHATKSNLTTEQLLCNNQTQSLLVGQNTTTKCVNVTDGLVAGGISTIKAQAGSGQPLNAMPNITSQFTNLANGIIQVVNNVIIPKRLSMSPSGSPSQSPTVTSTTTDSPTEFQTQELTQEPTTDSPTDSPTSATDSPTADESTDAPSPLPTASATDSPTEDDSTEAPTPLPTLAATDSPTEDDSTEAPTPLPTSAATDSPTEDDSTEAPTPLPTTDSPTNLPTDNTDAPTPEPPTTESSEEE